MIKSRIIRWAGHVARMGRREAYTGFWLGNVRERDHLEDPGVDGKDNIKMDLQEVGCRVWIGSSWLRLVTGGGYL